MRKLFTLRTLFVAFILFFCVTPKTGFGQIAAWDFTGENTALPTSAAEVYNAN